MMTIVSLVGLVVLAAPGCRGDGGRGADDTLPPPPSTTSTTALSYDVPAVIDEAYVTRVMQALDHVYGDAVRLLATTRQVNEDFLRYLVAIHNPRIYGLVQDLWVKTQAQGFDGLAAAPADPRTRIDKLLRADRDCVLVEGDRDFTPLHRRDDPTNHSPFVALTPLRGERNPGNLNPTPWTINFYGDRPDGSLPEDACVAQ
jgi:hypothetical protein